ncbi:Inner membrane protein YbaL [archaeon HR06]|nr:Inner membrane protein YbaL [archaeon HR06]
MALEIVRDLAVIMMIASAITFLFYLLKQPLILGYILSGIIIGPYTPPFSLISEIEFLKIFAEFGVILLLFTLGLDFPLAKLRRISKVSLGVAVLEIFILIFLGYLIASSFSWSFFDSLFLGAALSISSTAIIVKILEDYKIINEESSIIMLGILIMEDLIAVAIIAVLQSLASLGQFNLNDIFFFLINIVLFIGGSLYLGRLTVPRFIDKIASIGRRELNILASLGTCFTLSFIANILGFSVATGAFIAGVLIAGSKSSKKINEATEPLKEMFSALFFISVGALMNIILLLDYLIPSLIITLITVVAKILSVSFGVKIFGYKGKVALRVGLGMAQIGEFSFIIVKLGDDMRVVSPFLYPLVGSVVTLTTLLTPYFIRLGLRKLS